MPMRLSDINFERFSDVEIHDVFDGLVDFGITPLIALADVVEEETHAAFANSVINEIQVKIEDLQSAIERLSEQWEQGRLKPNRIKEFGEETEAKIEAVMKGEKPIKDGEFESKETISVELPVSYLAELKKIEDFLDNLYDNETIFGMSATINGALSDIKKQRPEAFQKEETSETPASETPEASGEENP